MAQSLSLVALSAENDDWGIYASADAGENTFGTPLMLRGTRDEIVDFLASRGLTGKVEL